MKAAIEEKVKYEIDVIQECWSFIHTSLGGLYTRGILVGLRFHHNPGSEDYDELSFLIQLTHTIEELPK